MKVRDKNLMVYQSRAFRKDLHARVCILAAKRWQRLGRKTPIEAMMNEVVEAGLKVLEKEG